MRRSPLQKCSAAFQKLAYCLSADTVDDYSGVGDSRAIGAIKTVLLKLGKNLRTVYLRGPDRDYVFCIEKHFAEVLFPSVSNV